MVYLERFGLIKAASLRHRSTVDCKDYPITRVRERENTISVEPACFLLTVPGRPIAFSICLFAALVGALLRSAIPPLSLEMIDTGLRVHPYNGIVWAVLSCLLF